MFMFVEDIDIVEEVDVGMDMPDIVGEDVSILRGNLLVRKVVAGIEEVGGNSG